MRRLLIVDDERALLRSMELFLAEPDLAVEVATEREQALALMRTPFDGLIVDLDLAGGNDGLALLRAAREACPKAALILLTGAALDHEGAAREAGADVVLEKPMRLPALKAVLDGLWAKTERSG
jgi:DNA-binding response OmpR family regulator